MGRAKVGGTDCSVKGRIHWMSANERKGKVHSCSVAYDGYKIL